jgi:hypothetical protein
MLPMNDRMPPPGKKPSVAIAVGIDPKKPMQGGDDDAQGKESETDAIVLRGGEKTCESCTNYDMQNGACKKVQGQFDPDDRCLRYYSAGSEQNEEREEGESPTSMPPPGAMGEE